MKIGPFVVASILAATSAQANIVTGGSGAGGDAFFTLSQDVTFNIEANHSGDVMFIVDEANSGGIGSPVGAVGMVYEVNGSGSQDLVNWFDGVGGDVGDVAANDSYFMGQSESLSIGNTITLKAGTHTAMQAVVGFEVFASGAYNMFLTNDSGTRISDIQLVPESATMGLFGLTCCAALMVRRFRI